MENWAAEPEVMKMFAKHYKTGEVIPDALIEKIEKAGTFDQDLSLQKIFSCFIFRHGISFTKSSN